MRSANYGQKSLPLFLEKSGAGKPPLAPPSKGGEIARQISYHSAMKPSKIANLVGEAQRLRRYQLK